MASIKIKGTTNKEIVKFGKHYFKWEDGIVSKVERATPEHLKDNEEWIAKYGKPLWDIEDGFIEITSAGLCRENWENKEIRNEYLREWLFEIDEETQYLADQFIKYELNA